MGSVYVDWTEAEFGNLHFVTGVSDLDVDMAWMMWTVFLCKEIASRTTTGCWISVGRRELAVFCALPGGSCLGPYTISQGEREDKQTKCIVAYMHSNYYTTGRRNCQNKIWRNGRWWWNVGTYVAFIQRASSSLHHSTRRQSLVRRTQPGVITLWSAGTGYWMDGWMLGAGAASR